MTPTEYAKAAARTANPDNPQAVQILYAFTGLVGEWQEYKNATCAEDEFEEFGDVLWGLAEFARVWGFPLARTANPAMKREATTDLILSLAEPSKKWACHSKPREKYLAHVEDTVCEIMDRMYTHPRDFTVEDAMAHNIAKLKRRHPDGFSADYKDKPDVLAGYEWVRSLDSLELKSADLSAPYVVLYRHIGDWVVWDSDGDTRIATGLLTGALSDEINAEAALRAHLEAKL